MGALSGYGFSVFPENIKVLGNILVEVEVEVIEPKIEVSVEIIEPKIEVDVEVICP